MLAAIAPSDPSRDEREVLVVQAPFLGVIDFLGKAQRLATIQNLLRAVGAPGMTVEALQASDETHEFISFIAYPPEAFCRLTHLEFRDGREESGDRITVTTSVRAKICFGWYTAFTAGPLAFIELYYFDYNDTYGAGRVDSFVEDKQNNKPRIIKPY